MVSEGTVLRDGSPWDVMTEDAIRQLYGVESRVVDVEGRPHVILLTDGIA